MIERALGVMASVALGACGARTALQEAGGEGDGGQGGAPFTSASSSTSSSASSTAASTGGASSSSTASSGGSRPDCQGDEDCQDDVACTIDVCERGACLHAPDHAACDDGVLCTMDSCLPSSGCQNVFSNAPCEDGLGCTIDTCDTARDACVHDSCDSLCDDGDFCNGVERCDTTFGCTAGAPACQLDLGCDVSNCSAPSEQCVHVLPPGCTAPDLHLVVTDSSGALHDVAPYASQDTLIAATTGDIHLDIAILDGRWFTIGGGVVELVPFTNQQLRFVASVSFGANSLAGGPDGWLYAADTSIYRIEPDNGVVQVVGSLPPGHVSSGDIAFLDNRMFVSTDSDCGGALVEFDLDTQQATVLGGDGLGCVYGLASWGSVLVIVNCDGKVGTFDPLTGEARVFTTTQVFAYGADLLP